jgi:pyrroline-5-carboxylate reductase
MFMSEIQTKKYAFLGGGIIAGVFIERLLRGGGLPVGNLLATDIRPERLEELKSRFGVRVSPDNGEGAEFGDVVFLAVPPNAVKPVLTDVREKLRPRVLVVSLAAAIPTSLMEEAVGQPVGVVRVIPNTPSLIGRGMNPHCLGKHVRPDDLPFIDGLLALFGETIRVEERLMNVATALTAVGPTYVFPVIKSLKDTAVRLGLPEQVAQWAAAHTVLGSAQLVLETGKDPDELKLMIGTRTLKEDEAQALFSGALETAFEKISGTQRKLAQAQ